MTRFADYQNGFANARLSRSKSGVLEVVLHTNGNTLLFTGHTHEQFVDLFHAIGSDPDNRVVILTGSGPAFMESISPEGFDFFSPQGIRQDLSGGQEGPDEPSGHRGASYRRRQSARCGSTPNLSCSRTSCWPYPRRFFKTSRTSTSASSQVTV